MQSLTPYAAAKVTNIALASRSLDKRVTPQMLYTYAKKQLIATVPDTKPIEFDGDAFKAWLDKYIAKVESGDAGARVDYDELAKQFM